MEHKTGPKEVFSHLLSIVMLYVSVGSFITLLFQFVNVTFPDLLEVGTYAREGALSAIRWAIASLLVVFPTYLWTMRMLRKNYAKEPAVREMRVRKWLIYFTLFAAGLLMIGDLVVVVFNFLDGDLTVRFILKAAAMLLTAGMVFFYYLWEMREGSEGRVSEKTIFRFFVIPVMCFVLAGIIGGTMVAGSPQTKRLSRFDDQRLGDLANIQSYIVQYWMSKQALPQTLDVLNDDLRGVRIPADPKTGESYEYEKQKVSSFSLCATFELPSASNEIGSVSYPEPYEYPAEPYGGKPFIGNESVWTHEAGRVCFERTLDPDFFTKVPK